MALSAAFTVNSAANPAAHSVAYGATVNLALTALTGIKSVSWVVSSKSHSSAVAPTITPAGTPTGATASYTHVADPGDGQGRSFRVSVTVQNDAGQTATQTALVGTANALGIIPVCPDETTERHATQGYTDALNAAFAVATQPGGDAEVRVALLPQETAYNAALANAGTLVGTLTLQADRYYLIHAQCAIYDASNDLEYTKGLLLKAGINSGAGENAVIDVNRTLDDEFSGESSTFIASASGADVLVTLTNNQGGNRACVLLAGYTTWIRPQ